MIYGYSNSKEIIAKVFRDFGIQDSDWIYDAIEWIGEALEHIGTYHQVVSKTKPSSVHSFRAKMPKDLYILDSIRYNDEHNDSCPEMDEFNKVLRIGENDLFPGMTKERTNIRLVESGIIDGSFLKTSFETGWVLFQYKGFALDPDGYPLIPDAVEYKEALMWYIIMKMILRGLQHPIIGYEAAEQRWLKYATQARNQSNMPDVSRYREFRDKWVTMIPEYDRDMTQLERIGTTAENLMAIGHPNRVKRLS